MIPFQCTIQIPFMWSLKYFFLNFLPAGHVVINKVIDKEAHEDVDMVWKSFDVMFGYSQVCLM